MTPQHSSKSALDLISTTSEVLGAGVGAGAGFLAGGPGGAVLGGATGAALGRVLDVTAHELQERYLSTRGLQRIGTALWFASLSIESRLNCNQHLREDGFFRDQSDNRSAAEEIAEHVLLAARDDPEEKN